jgi:sarcosine oxidase
VPPTRRELLAAGAVLAASAPVRVARVRTAVAPTVGTGQSWDSVVIGAGVFGAWTAEHLRRAGQRVLLLDANGPANARASSGGESRLIRGTYGADAVYTRMALASLAEWRRLSADAGPLPLFHPTGVLFLFEDAANPYAQASIATHQHLGIALEQVGTADLAQRWPQINPTGLALGLHEPVFGALMARRAVLALVAGYTRAGGQYRHYAVLPPAPGGTSLTQIRTSAGDTIRAGQFVFAGGPWMPALFPDLLARRIFVTRQEVFFFAPPAGSPAFGVAELPGWVDWNGGDLYYGFPDLENRGFKIARDAHGVLVDPDTQDRRPTDAALADARTFMERRFPAMRGAPLVEARVCQYENSANGDFLIDRHPAWDNVVLVGAGSGHGFKHGPEVGRLAAALALEGVGQLDPRFSLASKGEFEARAVH